MCFDNHLPFKIRELSLKKPKHQHSFKFLLKSPSICLVNPAPLLANNIITIGHLPPSSGVPLTPGNGHPQRIFIRSTHNASL